MILQSHGLARLLVFAAAFLSCFSARAFAADKTCEIIPSSWDEDFGSVRLGVATKSVPSDLEAVGSCDRAHCKFLDRSGISYESYDGKVIAVKELDLSKSPDGKLPFGLVRGDDISKVIKRLFEDSDVPLSIRTLSGDKIAVFSGPCFMSRYETVFHAIFVFGADGRIAGVSLGSAEAMIYLEKSLNSFGKTSKAP